MLLHLLVFAPFVAAILMVLNSKEVLIFEYLQILE